MGAVAFALVAVALVASACGGRGRVSTTTTPVAPATAAAAILPLGVDATCGQIFAAPPAISRAYLADPRYARSGLDAAELLRRCADAPGLRPDDLVADQNLAVALLMKKAASTAGAVASQDFLRKAAAAVPATALSGDRTGAIASARLHRVEQGLRRTVGGCRTLKRCSSTAGCSQPDAALGVLECAVTTTGKAPPDSDGTTNGDGGVAATYGAAMTIVFVRVLLDRDGHATLRR